MNSRTIKFVGLSNRRTIELSDYRTVGPSNRRTIELGLSDYRTVGLSNRRTIEPSDYRSVPTQNRSNFVQDFLFRSCRRCICRVASWIANALFYHTVGRARVAYRFSFLYCVFVFVSPRHVSCVPMSPVSLDCPFLIAHSVFSRVSFITFKNVIIICLQGQGQIKDK
jgi:hypothetical protein